MIIVRQHLELDTTVLPLTGLQRALLQTSLPILDDESVIHHKKHARIVMLWQSIRWLLLAMAVLVAFESLGRQWFRAGIVGAAAVTLTGLFTWMVNKYDLQWSTLDYSTYCSLYAVPDHVSTAAETLKRHGIADAQIGVEYLKDDPILYVKENGERYNLIIW